MSRFAPFIPLGLLVAVFLYGGIVSNLSNRDPCDPTLCLDQHGPDDHHSPQELPGYRVSMSEGSPTYYINGYIEGWNFSAHTKSTDAELLAQATEAIYEKYEAKWTRENAGNSVPPTCKVIFWHANHTFATGFYFEEKYLENVVLTEAQLSRATVEGHAYVLSGDVQVRGLEDQIATD